MGLVPSSSPGPQIYINGDPYTLFMDHESYRVQDIPSHPDTDPKTERRVIFNNFKSGVRPRRESFSTDSGTEQYYASMRSSRVTEGFWWGNGCYTGLADRIFGQRGIQTSQSVASAPLFMGDSVIGSYIACKQHVYYLNGIISSVQQVTLSKDFSAINPAVNITDAISFGGKLYIATCQTTSGVPDPSKPQVMWVHDETSTTVNWTNPPSPLTTVTNLTVTPTGTTGSTRWDYQVFAVNATSNSVVNQAVSVKTGNATLTNTNYNALAWTAVAGATSYTILRSFAGGTPNTTGVIATGIATTTYNDQGAAPSSLQSTLTPGFAIGDTGRAIAFLVIRNTLWRAAGNSMWSWDGAAGTWSSASFVGDPNTNITGLDLYKDGLIVFKQDGVYTMDRSGQVYPIFPGFRTLGFNLRPIGQWRGAYYFASDIGMIWEWDGGKVERIGFDMAEPFPMAAGSLGLPNVVTRGVALPNFLVVGFNQYNSTANKGYFLAFDGNGWHPFRFDSANQVSGLGLTGGNQVPTNPTLQFGLTTQAGGAALNFMATPTLDPFLSVLFDSAKQDLYLPVDNGVIEDETKVLEKVSVIVENSNKGTVNVAYAIDDNIQALSYTDLGPPDTAPAVRQIFTPTSPLPTYKKISLKLSITPTGTTGSPMLRSVVLRYKQREPQRRAWFLTLFLEEGQRLPLGGIDSRTIEDVLTALNTARQTGKLVEFVDIVGDTYQVYVEAVEEALQTFRNSQFPSFVCKIRLVEPVNLSAT